MTEKHFLDVKENSFMHYDLKGFILYVGAISLTDINQMLTTSGLALNVFYIGYQLYKFHKKKDGNDNETN